MKKRKTVALILAAAMVSSLIPAKNLTVQAENYQISTEKTEKIAADGNLVLDSAWEVENPTEGHLKLNEDGSITITSEKGALDEGAMKNVLYYKLPNSTDYQFTVKVQGNFSANYQGAHLMITSGKNLQNAVGVVRRYHGYLGGNYGTNMLMGVMQNGGSPSEYYEGATEIGDTFYLKLQKQNGRITGYYSQEYSDNAQDWNKIVDTTKNNIEFVDKGSALIDPENIYLAIAASNGGGNTPTEITFSDLRVGGEPVSFTTDPTVLASISLDGAKKMEVNGSQKLTLAGKDYHGKEISDFDSVIYKSSDEEVAVVDENGIVTGKKNGNVVITAEASKSGITKTAEIEIQVGEIIVENSWELISFDGNTKMTVELLTGGTLQYRAEQDGVMNIETSPLGLVTDLGDFSKKLVVKNVSDIKEINETYEMISGKKDTYVNHCKEQTLTFVKKDNPSVEFDLIIRVYDDGTAYRYAVRTENEGEEIQIKDEISGLQLPGEANVYWMNYASSTWNYEGQYEVTTTEGLKVNSTPSMPMLYEKDGVYTLFSEADLNGSYTGSMFTVGENGLLDVSFSKSQSGAVVTTVPFKSPWRAAITGTEKDIVENTMIENLSTPADYDTYDFDSWVEPGLSSWSWVANWGSGISDQSKKETHLNWIEFGSEIGWKYYILDEGWNPGGRGHINGMYDWWPEVRDYAKEKGVKLWVWVHVSDIDTKEEREKHFSEWEKEGIVGIKPDFFDGEGQDKMKLYDELYKDAANHHLMLLVHGANKPTGEIRTWPNVYGREAIRGQEAGGITAEQYTMIPFIRAAVGPAEVTEEIRSKDFNKTTMGFQIALTALVEDGIHSMGSAPDAYREIPEGMSYYKNYPDGWDNTEFVNGEVGKYLSIARQAGSNWYVSGISVEPRTMEIPCSFLKEGEKYTALLYKENGRRDIDMEVVQEVNSQSVLKSDVLAGGGYALRIIPISEIDGITSIIPEKTEVAVEKGRTSESIKITTLPENAEFRDVVWTSLDESVATVDAEGRIRGIAEGETTIVVASRFDKNVKAEIKVKVEPEKYLLNEKVWTVLNPSEQFVINSETSATITTEYGVLGDKKWKNMFAMDVPNGEKDFTITAKISGGLQANYQGGFITVFDKENPDQLSVAAGRRYHSGMMGNHPQAMSMMTTGGSVPEFYCEDTEYNEDVYVKLEKKGNTFVGSYSYDGDNWNIITNKGTEMTVLNDKLAASENLCVGFYAGAGGSETPVDVTISDFMYNGQKMPIAVENKKPVEIDKTELLAAIEYAKSQQKKEEYQYLIPLVKEKFEAALATAEEVNSDMDATQEAVDAAYDNLLKMIHHLSFTGNTNSLKMLVDAAKGLLEEVYTPETWNVFTEALKSAEKVLAEENALQPDIDAARNALQTAMDNLKKIPVDKSKLEQLVKESEIKYESKLDEYTEETRGIFQEALDAARGVLTDETATQEQVQAAHDNLRNAIFGLRLIPNKDALEDLINRVEKLNLSVYSVETQKVLTNALNSAKIVFADKNATQTEIDNAVKLLQASVDGLKTSETTDNNKPSGSTSTNKKPGTVNSENKTPVKTGDEMFPFAWSIAGISAIFAVAAALFAGKKKQERRKR